MKVTIKELYSKTLLTFIEVEVDHLYLCLLMFLSLNQVQPYDNHLRLSILLVLYQLLRDRMVHLEFQPIPMAVYQ